MSQLDLTNMVLNDIEVGSITNTDGTGVFDKLMSSVSNNINTQYNENRITSSQYAEVYLGSLQTVLQQSIQFVLQEQLSEVQVASAIADNTLKNKSIEIADIDKSIKQFELDNVLPATLLKLGEEIDVLQTQDSEMLLDGIEKRKTLYTDRVIKDKQAAKLGLDNAMKLSEASKNADDQFLYTPKYTG